MEELPVTRPLTAGERISPKILAHYSHATIQAKRTALDALSTKQAERANSGGETGGYDTNHDTNQAVTDVPAPEVIENMVGTWGLEPQTSTVSR